MTGKFQISVIDDGKGIPSEILNQVGNEGFTYGKPQGTGLGLHDAITTVRKWNGELTIESQPQIGTIVVITLPIRSIF